MKTSIRIYLAILLIGFAGFSAQSRVTIATFADPAESSSTPLFVIDLGVGDYGVISGGWSEEGLDLHILDTVYPDATFVMSDVNITNETSPFLGVRTQGGSILFRASDDSELLEIIFEAAWVSLLGFGAGDADVVLQSDNVTITGPALNGLVLSDESFAFSFTNHIPLEGDYQNGFTATASFTSSAVIPEPMTVALFGFGALALSPVGMIRRNG